LVHPHKRRAQGRQVVFGEHVGRDRVLKRVEVLWREYFRDSVTEPARGNALALGVHGKEVIGIHDVRDESDREGLRLVVELAKGADADVVAERARLRAVAEGVARIMGTAPTFDHWNAVADAFKAN
jgi:hypothetical protein